MMIRHTTSLLFLLVLLACSGYSFGAGAVSSSRAKDIEATTNYATFLRGGQHQLQHQQLQLRRQLDPFKCGCDSCTENVLNSDADGYSCGNRIDWVVANEGVSESDACFMVANKEFSAICGGCDPSQCTSPDDDDEEEEDDSSGSPSDDTTLCGCSSCTENVWNTLAGDYTCGARISWLQAQSYETLLGLGITNGPLDEAGACKAVSEEFSEICTCHPETCNNNDIDDNENDTPEPTSGPTDAPTPDPTASPTDSPTDSPTREPTASPTDSPTDSPTREPTPSPTDSSAGGVMCGCDSCTTDVLNSVAGDYNCGDRISWVIDNKGLSESDSCKLVADEFQSVCGKCHSEHCGDFPTPPPIEVPVGGASVTVMSYNTEYKGYWDGRLPYFAAKIVEVNPYIVGLQECQDPDALANDTGYALLRATGPQNYILYDSDRLQELERGSMTIPRDDYAQRAITWGKFRVLRGAGAGSEFWFFNTHLPHRQNQASDPNTHARIGRMLLSKRDELGAATDPVIVVGDCNPFASAGASEGSFESNLAQGGITKVYEGRGNTGGFSGLDKIFASQQHWNWSNASDRGTGRSDHPAIAADLTLK